VNWTPSLLVLLLLPALAAALTYFMGTWERTPAAAACVASVAAAALLRPIPAGSTATLLGRDLALTIAAKQLLLAVIAATALANLMLTLRPINHLFPPASLGAVSFIGFAVTLEDLSLSCLCLLLATVVMTMAWEVEAKPRGHVQYLVAMSFAAIALTLAAIAMPETALTPHRVPLASFALATGLFLALVPFGSWEITLWRDSDAISSSFTTTALKPAALILLWRFTERYQWLVWTPMLTDVLRAALVATVLYGSVRAAVAASDRVFGAAVAQAQFALVVLSVLPAFGSSSLLPVTAQWLVARAPVVLLLAVAVTIGRSRNNPIAQVIVALSVLACIGLPGTPLFPAQFSALTTLSEKRLLFYLLVALASGLVVGTMRLGEGRGGTRTSNQRNREALSCAIVLVVLNLLLGFRPSLIVQYLQ